MALLEKLKLVTAVERKTLPVIEQRRQKLLGKLAEQIEFAAAQQQGQSYQPLVSRSVKDPDTGEIRQINKPKRIRAWWFTLDTGKLYLSIKYGHRALELAKGKTGIELANKDELLPTLKLLEDAIRTGELDEQINQATSKLKSGFAKKS